MVPKKQQFGGHGGPLRKVRHNGNLIVTSYESAIAPSLDDTGRHVGSLHRRLSTSEEASEYRIRI